MAKVVNMTVMCNMTCKFNLCELRELGFKYDPTRFTAARYRSYSPRYSALVFSNGKVTLTGICTRKKAKEALHHLCNLLATPAKPVAFTGFTVSNRAGTIDLEQRINLTQLYEVLRGPFCSYETELFPGLFYRSVPHGVTLTFFSTGKVNFTGIRRSRQIKQAVKLIRFILQN